MTEEQELEYLLEAARRANWDALHGPMHLRSGRFRPEEGLRPKLPTAGPAAPVQDASPAADEPPRSS